MSVAFLLIVIFSGLAVAAGTLVLAALISVERAKRLHASALRVRSEPPPPAKPSAEEAATKVERSLVRDRTAADSALRTVRREVPTAPRERGANIAPAAGPRGESSC